MTIKELTAEDRCRYLLWMLHFMRCGTVLLLGRSCGIRTQTVSIWLKHWEKKGFVKKMGYAEIDPVTGLSGQWWIPTRKDPLEHFAGSPLRAIVRPLNDNDANQARCVRYARDVWLRRHELEAALAIAGIHRFLRTHRIAANVESETLLRTVRKWSGAPAGVAEHAQCHIISVPDIRVAGSDWAVNIEVESTIKSAKEYARYVENAEEGAIVLWLVKTKSAYERLFTALSKAGNGRTKGNIYATWDKLEAALELSIKRARGIVDPPGLAADTSAAA